MSGGPALIRALRGPVLLIAVGALFAIDNFAGVTFARTWPVLLILLGLFKLLELSGSKSS